MASFNKADWLVPTGLIALAFIPVMAGVVRLTLLASGAPLNPENARFVHAPIPVVLHIVSVTLYSLLGAFQFAPGFRRRRPDWHRAAGRVLVVAGMIAALSGLWMALFYAIVPADSALLHGFRLLFGSAMALSIVFGYLAIRRRDVARHQDWMCRAYALALAAGTQAITQLPLLLLYGAPDELTLALMMGAAWVANLAAAEWFIRGKRIAASIRQSAEDGVTAADPTNFPARSAPLRVTSRPPSVHHAPNSVIRRNEEDHLHGGRLIRNP
jgi:uncharacterized membrane protein